MRVHKYGAWDTVKKVMYSAEELGADQETLSVDGRGFVNVSGDSTRLSQFHTHLLPLQYIGLHDKNRVEIYESDYVKYLGRIWQIQWMWCGFVLMEPGDAFNVIILATKPTKTWEEILEVVGNIYSNPELLGCPLKLDCYPSCQYWRGKCDHEKIMEEEK